MVFMPTQRSVTATVPPELLERSHERAELEDGSVASVVRRALTDYLGPTLPSVPSEEMRTEWSTSAGSMRSTARTGVKSDATSDARTA
jgi:hypothetical protein